MTTENCINNLIRVGQVSSINAATGAVRVTFNDKDALVSAELPVLNRGSQAVKDYWLPDVGEQVVCVFLPNGKSLTTGFVLGSFFSSVDRPPTSNLKMRIIDFGDGTNISYDRMSKALVITCSGTITIDSKTTIDGRVFLSHKHTGVESGSGSTGGVS